jgi:rhodanese-related sulfurtransferase
MDYEITPEEVKTKLDRGEEFTLLDVREPWELETAQMVGAKLVPMGDIPSRAHQEFDPDDHIVVVCHHGVRSMNVTAWSRQVDANVPTY